MIGCLFSSTNRWRKLSTGPHVQAIVCVMCFDSWPRLQQKSRKISNLNYACDLNQGITFLHFKLFYCSRCFAFGIKWQVCEEKCTFPVTSYRGNRLKSLYSIDNDFRHNTTSLCCKLFLKVKAKNNDDDAIFATSQQCVKVLLARFL